MRQVSYCAFYKGELFNEFVFQASFSDEVLVEIIDCGDVVMQADFPTEVPAMSTIFFVLST